MAHAPYRFVGIPDAIKKHCPATIDKLLELRLKGDFERLRGPKLRGQPLFSMRINDTERLLFVLVQDTLCFYQHLPTHDYEAAKRKIEADNANQIDLPRLLDGLTLLPVSIHETEADDAAIITDESGDHRQIYYKGKTIELDDIQQAALYESATPTQVLTGPPGSGKTCVIAARLARWAKEAAAPGLSWAHSSRACSSSSSSSSSTTSSSMPTRPTHPTIFYIAESQELHVQMQKALENQLSDDALAHIECCTYESLLKKIDPTTPHKTFFDNAQSKARFSKDHHINQLLLALTPSASKTKAGRGAATAVVNINIDMLFQEFVLMAGLSLKDYLNRGIATSYFAHLPRKEREKLHKACVSYGMRLHDESVVDPHFYYPTDDCFQRLRETHPGLSIAVDETQDYPFLATKLMHQAAYEHRVLYGIDTHQQTGNHASLSIRPYLIQQLQATPLALTAPYRLPNIILDLSNTTLKLKALACDKRMSDKSDYGELKHSKKQCEYSKVGFVKWTSMASPQKTSMPSKTKPQKAKDAGKHAAHASAATSSSAPTTARARLPAGAYREELLAATQGKAGVAVITRPELVYELKELLGKTPVMTPHDIKGLEFDTIITWDLLHDPSFHETNTRLTANPLAAPSAQGRSKDKANQLKQLDPMTAFNALYTAQTRTTRALYMYEFEDPHRTGKIARAYQETIQSFGDSNKEDEADRPGVSSPLEWRALMHRFIQQGDNLNAKAIWADDNCWHDASAAERGESFDAYREQRFVLTHPRKASHATSSISSSTSSSAASSVASSSSQSLPMHNRNKGPKRKSRQQKPKTAAQPYQNRQPAHRSPVTSSVPMPQQLDHQYELQDACVSGDIEKLQTLLQQGVDPNTLLEDGVSALYVTATLRHTNCMQLLLDNGANIRVGKYHPIFGAVEGRDIEAIRMLLPKAGECSSGERIDIFNSCIRIADTKTISFLTSKEVVARFFSHLPITETPVAQIKRRDYLEKKTLMTACSNVNINLLAAALYTGANCNFEYIPPVSTSYLQIKVTPLITLLIKVVTTNILTNEILAGILLLKNYGADIEASQTLLKKQFPNHGIGEDYAHQLACIAKYHLIPPPITRHQLPQALIEEVQRELANSHSDAYQLDIMIPAFDRFKNELARERTDESDKEIQTLFKFVHENITANTVALTQTHDSLFYHTPTSTVSLEESTVIAEDNTQPNVPYSKSM